MVAIQHRDNNMKPKLFFLFILLLDVFILPNTSLALCFTIYDSSDHLIYKSVDAPIDLSGTIEDGMKQKFPNDHLTYYDESNVDQCVTYNPNRDTKEDKKFMDSVTTQPTK